MESQSEGLDTGWKGIFPTPLAPPGHMGRSFLNTSAPPPVPLPPGAMYGNGHGLPPTSPSRQGPPYAYLPHPPVGIHHQQYHHHMPPQDPQYQHQIPYQQHQLQQLHQQVGSAVQQQEQSYAATHSQAQELGGGIAAMGASLAPKIVLVRGDSKC